MKRILYSLLLTAGLFSFIHKTELPIGAAMPKADIKMKDISGKEVSLKEAQGKNGLLVMFSCNTCPYVVKNQERTREICKFAAENSIGVILVNSNEAQRGSEDSYEAMKEYARDQNYEWYYTMDQNSVIADAFDAKRTPENFLFNKEGKLVYHGAIDDNPSDAGNVSRKHLQEAIKEMVTGKEISLKTSRSVGCSIKRL